MGGVTVGIVGLHFTSSLALLLEWGVPPTSHLRQYRALLPPTQLADSMQKRVRVLLLFAFHQNVPPDPVNLSPTQRALGYCVVLQPSLLGLNLTDFGTGIASRHPSIA